LWTVITADAAKAAGGASAKAAADSKMVRRATRIMTRSFFPWIKEAGAREAIHNCARKSGTRRHHVAMPYLAPPKRLLAGAVSMLC
jgi:hypothetical protein